MLQTTAAATVTAVICPVPLSDSTPLQINCYEANYLHFLQCCEFLNAVRAFDCIFLTTYNKILYKYFPLRNVLLCVCYLQVVPLVLGIRLVPEALADPRTEMRGTG